MPDSEERYVCSLSLVMRTRLLCGLYCRRAVRPCLRPFAIAYCLILPVAFGFYIYFTNRNSLITNVPFLHWFFFFVEHLIASTISLWTGDEYVYTYFTQNRFTDVSLDSPAIFKCLQKKIRKTYFFGVMFYCSVHLGLSAVIWGKYGFATYIIIIFPIGVRDLIATCSCLPKQLVMALFNSRILVLRRRLERHGFRTVGHAQPQPYIQIYDEILQGLHATDKPLKFLVFLNLIVGCCRIISPVMYIIDGFIREQRGSFESFLLLIYLGATVANYIFDVFAHVVMLESAAAHCEDMAIFTATQLIKTPTAEERRRMHQFLNALTTHGVSYQLLRAMTFDARLVLQAFGFCFAQVIVLYNVLNH